MAYRGWFFIVGVALGGQVAFKAAGPQAVTIYNFNDLKNGANVYSGLIVGPGGVLYGTTQQGGLLTGICGADGCGTVYQLTPPSSQGGLWKETVVYRFASQTNDGYYPAAALTMGANGVLYGTTTYGGVSGSTGTVFQLTPPGSAGGAWTESVIHSFSGGGDGIDPLSPLTLDSNGVLYGTTVEGGSAGAGTVFALEPPSAAGGAWTENILHSFTGGADGINPYSGVVIGAGGALFGTTYLGGTHHYGTVFQLTPPGSAGGGWTETILYSFAETSGEGYSPVAGVTMGAGGALYGTTENGGYYGTVFQLTPPANPGGTWTESTIYTFTDEGGDWEPCSNLTVGKGGVLYGTTIGGSAFALQPPAAPGGSWTEVYSLGAGPPSCAPLALDSSGVLYGTTTWNLAGTAFEVLP